MGQKASIENNVKPVLQPTTDSRIPLFNTIHANNSGLKRYRQSNDDNDSIDIPLSSTAKKINLDMDWQNRLSSFDLKSWLKKAWNRTDSREKFFYKGLNKILIIFLFLFK